MRIASALAGACVLSVAVAAAQQQPAQAPVFRTRIDVARVDVTVIDNRTGKPVNDLTQADFTVSENGVAQKITTFARELITAESATTPGPAAIRPASAGIVAPRNRRVFLMVLGQTGEGGIGRGPVKAYEGVLEFIRERLLPQDLVSIMAFNRATDFTTDRGYLARVVERVKAARDAITYDLFLTAPLRFGPIVDVNESIQASIDAVFSAPGSPEPAPRSATTMLIGTEEYRRWEERRTRPWNRMVIGSDLLKIYAGVEHLRHLEGEKHLIAIAGRMTLPIRVRNMPPGLVMNSREDNVHLATRANDAQVAIDIINTDGTFISHNAGGGLVVTAGTGALEIMGNQTVSELSGGLYTSARLASRQLARIDEASRAGYILGYTPLNGELDGKYRNVRVKVNRRDVTVLYRHGYTANNNTGPLNLREIVTSERIAAAAATTLESNDIKLDVKVTSPIRSGPDAQVRVEMKVDASRLALTKTGDNYTGTLDLVIFCGDGEQKIVCALKGQMVINMDEPHFQRAMRDGIPYAGTLRVKGTADYVKVLVYDYDSDRLGSRIIKLR